MGPLQLLRADHDMEIVLEDRRSSVVDTVMAEVEATGVTDECWSAKFTVMKENIEHHIEAEEGEMFKQADSVLDADELRALGDARRRGRRSWAGPPPSDPCIAR